MHCCRSTCADEELVAGNALIEAGTFLAILLGTIVGGSIVLLDSGAAIVAGCGIGGAFAGWLASRQIPAALPHPDDAGRRPRLFHDSVAVIRHATSRSALLLPILAISWFWLFGATVVSGLPVLAKDVLFANERVVTLMLALFAIGVGAGSMLAERLLHGEVSARHVPVAALVMGLFAVDLHLASAGRVSGTELAGVVAFLGTPGSWRILGDLTGLAIAGGLFCVPLYALLQHESEPRYRARVIAANNIVNALAMTLAALVAAALSARGMTMGALFAVCGIATIRSLLSLHGSCARRSAKSVLRVVLRVLYRVRIRESNICAARCQRPSLRPITRPFSMDCCSAHFCRAIPFLRSTRSSPKNGGRSRF